MTRYSRVTTEERVTTVVYKSQAMKRDSAMAAQDAGLLNMRPYTLWLVMGAALILGLAAELKQVSRPCGMEHKEPGWHSVRQAGRRCCSGFVRRNGAS